MLPFYPAPPPLHPFPIPFPPLHYVVLSVKVDAQMDFTYTQNFTVLTYVFTLLSSMPLPPCLSSPPPLPPLLQGAAAGCKLLLCGRPAVDSKVLLQRSALLELVRQGEGEGGLLIGGATDRWSYLSLVLGLHWNLSIKDTRNNEHLSNEDSVCLLSQPHGAMYISTSE